jgi:hypothetical protein
VPPQQRPRLAFLEFTGDEDALRVQQPRIVLGPTNHHETQRQVPARGIPRAGKKQVVALFWPNGAKDGNHSFPTTCHLPGWLDGPDTGPFPGRDPQPGLRTEMADQALRNIARWGGDERSLTEELRGASPKALHALLRHIRTEVGHAGGAFGRIRLAAIAALPAQQGDPRTDPGIVMHDHMQRRAEVPRKILHLCPMAEQVVNLDAAHAVVAQRGE